MNILIILQQSVYTNDGKWTTADSNIQMHLGLIRNILKDRNDINFYLVLAPIEDFCDIKSYYELIEHPNVYFLSRPVPVNAFYGRIHFDTKWCEVNLYKKLMDTMSVVINNEPCLTRNLKTYFHFAGIKVPIVTQNFWMDCPLISEAKVDESISYDFRQIDGVVCSDLVPFTCSSTKSAFLENAVKRMGPQFMENEFIYKHNNSTIWDMGFDADDFSLRVQKSYTKTIIFPNRMSSINYTHHLEFIEAIKILSKKRKDFQVVFCNPSGKIEWQWLKDNVPNLHIIKEGILTRHEYIQALKTSHVGVSLYTMERYGGCANVEMLYCKLKVVMPHVFEYAVRGGIRYPFYVNMPLKPVDIAEGLDAALDSDYDMSEVSKRVYDMSSFQQTSKIVIHDLEKLYKQYFGLVYFDG